VQETEPQVTDTHTTAHQKSEFAAAPLREPSHGFRTAVTVGTKRLKFRHLD
jgi:hypothetical protein